MVAQQDAGFDQTKGFNVAGTVLQAHPNIVGFITLNDPMGLGAAAAIKAQGSKAISVGIDGGSDAVDAIKSGSSAFKASAAQPLTQQGQTAVDLVDQIVRTGHADAATGQVKMIACTLIK